MSPPDPTLLSFVLPAPARPSCSQTREKGRVGPTGQSTGGGRWRGPAGRPGACTEETGTGRVTFLPIDDIRWESGCGSGGPGKRDASTGSRYVWTRTHFSRPLAAILDKANEQKAPWAPEPGHRVSSGVERWGLRRDPRKQQVPASPDAGHGVTTLSAGLPWPSAKLFCQNAPSSPPQLQPENTRLALCPRPSVRSQEFRDRRPSHSSQNHSPPLDTETCSTLCQGQELLQKSARRSSRTDSVLSSTRVQASR